MLHLALIGIVCAVSAPIEDTTFFIGKNNESNVFCNIGGGEQNIVSLPNAYDVVLRNSSECAWNKIANKTSSFFYEYIIKQYQANKNSSCSIMESVSSEKNKKLRSKVGLHYRKKRNVSSKRKLPKTLRPPLGCRLKLRKISPCKKKLKSKCDPENKKCKSDLNCSEKKMFFQLLHPVQGKKTYKGHKRHLDRLKVDDDLDLNKRIEKLVKQIALENQRKENTAKEMILSVGIQDNEIENGLFEGKPPKKSVSLPFLNHIKKMFRFSKNYFNNKFNGVNSVPVNNVRGKDLVSNKAAHISSYDLLKTMRKTNRVRRNPYINHLPNKYNGKTVYKNELIEKTYPHSAYLKRKRRFICHRSNRKFISGYKRRRRRNMKGRKARRRGRKVKNWPLFKLNKNRDADSRLRRYDPLKNKEKFPAKRNANGRTSSSLITSSEDIEVNSVNKFNITDGNEKEYSPDQTLQKPFLKRNLKNRISGRNLDYNPITESPSNSINLRSTSKYKYLLPNEENLTPNRYLQIRHALRSYLFHNNILFKDNYVQLKDNNALLRENVLSPVKRNASPDRSKRCGKCCCKNNKCWRSPPLLCIPYIKKGQEDQLRYIIRILQSMVGKPFPPKVDIFDRTKFKPSMIKEKDIPCDYSQMDDYFDYAAEEPSNKYNNYAAPMSCPSIPPLTCTSPTTLPPTYPPTACPSVCPPFSQCGSIPINPYRGGSEIVIPAPNMPKYTESISFAPELPFSFPVFGKAYEQNTNVYNFDACTTTQPPLPFSPTPFCHTPIIPTRPFPLNPYAASCALAPPPLQPHLPSTPIAFPASPPTPAYIYPSIPPTAVAYKTLPGKNIPAASTESPVEQKEYFSFAAVSFNGRPEYATETFHYSGALNGKPRYAQMPPRPVYNTNQKYSPQRTAYEVLYAVPNNPNSYPLKPPQPQPQLQLDLPTTMNALQKPFDQKFEPQVPAYPKDYMKQIYPEYSFRNGHTTNDQRSQNSNILIMRSKLRTTGTYEEQFTPPTERDSQKMYEISENRLFKMHHKGTPKFPYRECNSNNLDNDFYNKYPPDIQKQKEVTFNDFPLSRSSWNNYWPKPDEVGKRTKSKRRKRGDDYSRADDFENYNDYFDDPGDGDECPKKQPVGNSKKSDLLTPPSYDMFSELAKVVTDVIITPSNTSIIASDGKNMEMMKSNEPSESFATPDSSSSKALTEENISDHSFLDSNSTPSPNTDLVTKTQNSQGQTDDSERSNSTENMKKNFGVSVSSVHSTTAMDHKDEKKSSTNRSLNSGDEGQIPTTLKMASIAKGQKKLTTKPSPKIYTKVYPDWLGNEPLVSETVVGTKDAVATTNAAQTTQVQSSISRADPKLQILAICEGYLEVIKLIKAQNLTPTKALDMNLAQYCENIISQNFNYQLDKSKKLEGVESSSQSARLNESTKFDDALKPNPEKDNDKFEYEFPDIIDEPVTKKPNKKGKKKNSKRKRKNKKSHNSDGNTTDIEANPDEKVKPGKKKKRKNHSSEKRDERQDTTAETEESLSKRVTQEQIELLKLLRKRKKALLSWLLNSKNQEKAPGIQETEYFQDDDDDYDDNFMETTSDVTTDSGTVKPKRRENTTGTTEKMFSYINESIFPVYAKQYGYNSGGEIREVEVLWRKVNEKTHEKKIFKNVSVLALLLTSTNSPDMEHEDTKFVGSNGYESEDISEIQSKADNKYGLSSTNPKYKISSTLQTTNGVVECKTDETNKTRKTDKSNKSTKTKGPNSTKSAKRNRKNATHTYITKPDASTIVGKTPKMNKTNSNMTHKTSHRFGAAKDFFQEYSIEFLNYAVYILPIMFTILFLFCCLCCAVHILHTEKRHKKKKKKKKKHISSEETTETTDECEFESKKRKRKRKSNTGSDGNLDFRENKKFWHVLKLHPRGNSETSQTEKKRSFLKFLKCKKEEGNICLPLCEIEETARNCHNMSEGKRSCDSDEHSPSRGRRKEEVKHKTSGDDEAAERRELIALLEELKKIETEHTEEKKEVKSVHVQYTSQEDENIFQRPEFSYPYEKNIFGLPKGYSFCSKQIPFRKRENLGIRDYEFYDGVNELTELLPYECGYYAKENDFCDFRINQEGRCKRFLKVFRDSGLSRQKPILDKNCRENESENRTFIFNKYRSINTDESDGLIGVTYKNTGTEVRFKENECPYRSPNNADVLEEVENLKRQLNKKNVRLKDKGVLCRL